MHNKHHDVLVAWAEGRPIQFRCVGQRSWVTVETEKLEQLSLASYSPCNPELEWRVKPDLPWYRVALMCRGDLFYTTSADSWAQEDNIMNSYFVRWLTDRISYEV